MGVVKANDVIDICYSPDLSHLNEDEQHVWGYHWNGLSLVIFPTQHVRNYGFAELHSTYITPGAHKRKERQTPT